MKFGCEDNICTFSGRHLPTGNDINLIKQTFLPQIVARFRNRSNSNTADDGGPRKKYRIVGAAVSF